jgi:Calcineurin-like phosphoesterase
MGLMQSRLAAVLLLLVCAPAGAAPLYWWKQPDERGGWQVRLLNAPSERCPAGTTVLSEPDTRFPVRVCIAPLGRRGVRIAGLGVVSPPGYVDRAVILGDAGCESEDQDCSDPVQWPFAQIAQSIARLNADLLVHVGDFLYRGTCSQPVQQPHCVDDWAAWEADFFTPARPLLQGSTWAFSRGNHEDCQRGGVGFSRLLGNGSPICELPAAPYLARLPNLDLLMLDTSYAPPYEIAENDPNKLDRYTRYIDRLAALSDREAWLVMHVPIWAFSNPGVDAGERFGSSVLQQAVRGSRAGRLPPNISLLLTGHIHVWEVVTWAGSTERPPILLAGNGGGGLSGTLLRPPDGHLDGLPTEAWGTNTEYGFMIADEVKQYGRRSWEIRPIRAPWGANDGYVCRFTGRVGGCEPPAPVIPTAPAPQP